MRYQILLVLGIALANLSFPAIARADCQPASSVEEALAAAEIAFVGTVFATGGREPGAALLVDEVWLGELPGTIEVRGMGDAGFMEDDRQWAIGVRYLVVPYVERGVLRDHICTATTEWRDELAVFKPEGARAPEEAPRGSGGGIPTEVLAVVAALAVLGIVGLIAFRHGSPSGRS